MFQLKTMAVHITHNFLMVFAVKHNVLSKFFKAVVQQKSIHFFTVVAPGDNNLYGLRQQAGVHMMQMLLLVSRTFCPAVLMNHIHNFIMASALGNSQSFLLGQRLGRPVVTVAVDVKIRINKTADVVQSFHNPVVFFSFLPSSSSLSHKLICFCLFHKKIFFMLDI